MKLLIESTTKIVALDGVPARVWEGTTESGIAVQCFITRVAVHASEDQSEFERELADCRTPSEEVAVFPARLVL